MSGSCVARAMEPGGRGRRRPGDGVGGVVLLVEAADLERASGRRSDPETGLHGISTTASFNCILAPDPRQIPQHKLSG